MKKYFVLCIAASLLILVGCKKQDVDYTIFAKCLQERGATEYGAFWCANCGKQAKLFNKKSQELPFYVECDPRGENEQSAICIAKNIEVYPTWEFMDGSRLAGVLSMEALSAITACSLPETNAPR